MSASTAHTASATPALLANDVAGGVFPEVRLRNDRLSVRVMLPDAERGYYRSSRFDWSGMIARAEFAGHTFFGEWRTPHDPRFYDHGVGPAEEFSSTAFGFPLPPHYAEARPGETFLKIGTGELEKPADEPYFFSRHYPIRNPGAWSVTHGADWAEFRQELTALGWGWAYTKRLELPARSARLVIRRTLRNTGTRPIACSHYGHNFLSIDRRPIGPGYRLRFPFAPAAARTLGGFGEIRGRAIHLTGAIPHDGVISTDLQGGTDTSDGNDVTVENTLSGAGIRITGDRPAPHWFLFAVTTALCPEPFVFLNVAPGDATTWSSVFEFLA